jgi:1,4-dihydroxy-2-naphthoate octaprenyltransferase
MTTTLSLPKWKLWLLAFRPHTLIASVSPVIIGTLMCSQFDPLVFLFTLFAALSVQIGTNLANDYFDYFKGADTSEREGPMRLTQSGLVGKAAVKIGFIMAFALCAIFSVFLIAKGGFVIALLAISAILLGILYTGGPFPIAYLGLSELFVFTFFGIFATAATAYLQTGVWSLSALLAGVGPGSLSCCILVANNLRDAPQDKKANKKTLVVRFGQTFGKWEYTFFLVSSLATPLFFCLSHAALSLTTLLLAVPALFAVRSLFKGTIAISSLFKITTLLLLCYTLFFFLGWWI